jgi:hypothetical protein
MGYGDPCARGERGSRVFLVCVRRPFFLYEYRRGRSYPRQASFFINKSTVLNPNVEAFVPSSFRSVSDASKKLVL